MENLKLIDKKILYQLDLNCKQTNSQIAKKLKTSKDVINYRIKNLEKKRILQGYKTIINTHKLGYHNFRIYLNFQKTDKKKEKEIFEFLKNKKNVWWLGKLTGRADAVIAYWCKSLKQYQEFIYSLKEKFKKNIIKEQQTIFAQYIHFSRAYLMNLEKDETEEIVIKTDNEEIVDKTDMKILRMLAENARESLVKISQATELTAPAVAHRIKNLEKKQIIVGYKAMIDFTKYNYEYYKVDLYLEDMSKVKELEEFCHRHPNIVYIDKSIGAGDFEFDMEVKSLNHFMQIMQEIKERFKEVIRNYEYFSVLEVYKILYFPD
jgi:Lrp/AsnC family leucine-responsive transcriptional regulator